MAGPKIAKGIGDILTGSKLGGIALGAGKKVGVGAFKISKGILKLGAVPVAAVVGDELVFSGEGRKYITESFENPDKLFSDLNDLVTIGGDAATNVSKELAQVGPEATFEGFYSFLEQIGIAINHFFGGETGLSLINGARDAQKDKAPLIATSDGLKTAQQIASENALNSSPEALSEASLQFKADFETAMEGRSFTDQQNVFAALREIGNDEMDAKIDEIAFDDELKAKFNLSVLNKSDAIKVVVQLNESLTQGATAENAVSAAMAKAANPETETAQETPEQQETRENTQHYRQNFQIGG